MKLSALLRKNIDASAPGGKISRVTLGRVLRKSKSKHPQGAPRTLIAAHEKRVTAAITKYLSAQAKRMIPLLVAAYKQPAKKGLLQTMLRKADLTPDEIVDKVKLEGWETLVNTDITPAIEAALIVAGLYAAVEAVKAYTAAAAVAAPVATMEVITGLVNERAVLYAQEAAAELVVNIADATRNMLRDKIAQAVREGWTSDQLAIELADSRAFSAARAMNIASYELGSALQAGNLIGWKASGVVTGKRWITADDILVDEDKCRANEAQGVIPLDEAFQSGDDAPLAHPNCIIGESVVAAAGVMAAYRRWFHGEVITIKTASGKSMTATPNHPVLSATGWIGVGLLKVGDSIFQCSDPASFVALQNPNDHNMPTIIEQITDTLIMSRSMSSMKVPSATVYFDGDGMTDGDVDIILSASHLMGNVVFADNSGNKQLVGAGDIPDRLDCNSSFANFAISNYAPQSCSMSSDNLRLALFDSHARPLDSLSLAGSAQSNSSLSQPIIDSRTADSEVLGKLQSRIAAEIPRTDQGIINDGILDTTFPVEHTTLFEPFSDNFTTDAKKGSDCYSGNTFGILSDNIVNIEVSEFSGHVYNLQTEIGWYFVDGIITHNCRCSMVPVTENA